MRSHLTCLFGKSPIAKQHEGVVTAPAGRSWPPSGDAPPPGAAYLTEMVAGALLEQPRPGSLPGGTAMGKGTWKCRPRGCATSLQPHRGGAGAKSSGTT